jgi:hypothetical protein
MSYVPPHRRASLMVRNATTSTPTKQLTKQEHREQFPTLRGKDGNAISIKPAAPVVVNWETITYEATELPRANLEDTDDGWVNLSVCIPLPDTQLTTEHLLACAERLENNWRRYYLERDLPIPKWITENPYETHYDFDREIPYSSNYVATISDTDSTSSVCDDEDEEYMSDHSM